MGKRRESICEPSNVCVTPAVDEVHVLREAGGAVGLCSEPADQDDFDAGIREHAWMRREFMVR